MTLELIPLCTATVSLDQAITVSSTLVIGEVSAIEVEGDRLRGSMRGHAAADWLQLSPEGYGAVDVRMSIETHDGAVIHSRYTGRLQLATMTAYVTPLFHTGDERYTWINSIQAVAKGVFADAQTLRYEMYELR